MQHRAYSTLEVRSVDDESRTITGVASTPVVDRQGDVVLPEGAEFEQEISLLLHHDSKSPVGIARLARAKDAILFRATIPHVVEPGRLKDRVDEAWHSLKYKLIRGVSIGFRTLQNGIDVTKDGGLIFKLTEILELSLVSVPANQQALISSIKSIDAQHLGVSAEDGSSTRAGLPARPPVRLLPSRREQTMKTLQEQIDGYQSTRDQKFKEQKALMDAAGEKGVTLDGDEADRYDVLDGEIEQLDQHISRLQKQLEREKQVAVPVNGGSPHAAAQSRRPTVVQVTPNEPPGIGFARAVLCKTAAFISQGMFSPTDFAKERFPDNDRLHAYLKAAIPAGTTTAVTWAAPLVDTTNLTAEFIAFLEPETIIGKLNLRRVPFNVRIPAQTSGGDGYWVGEGAPKPVTKFDFSALTLTYHKVASIAVITKELARFSVPNAERIVRDALAQAQIRRVDMDLLDPTHAAVAGVNPASLTNGVTPLSPSGTTADAARSDLARIIKTYLDGNNNVARLALVMPNSLALSLAMMRNSLGQREFPDMTMNGGIFEGIPVVASQHVANQSGAGNLVVAINQGDVLLADDGQVTVDVSTEASLQMLDNPTNSSATATATTMVSLWQTNSIGLLAERQITWAKARSTAVVYMDDVNWGSIGSPA